MDEDLARAGLTKLLPSKAVYSRSYLCRACELDLIDSSTELTRREAESALVPPVLTEASDIQLPE